MPGSEKKTKSSTSNKSKSVNEQQQQQQQMRYPVTPDGHYFVVRGRLWRCSNPNLTTSEREEHTKTLMQARRQMRKDQPESTRSEAKRQVDEAKKALGERGPVWWSQEAEEGEVCDRRMVWNTGYKQWWEALESQ